MKEITQEDIKMVVQGILGSYYKEVHDKHKDGVEAFIETSTGDLLSFSEYSHLVKNEQRGFEEVLLTQLLVEEMTKSEYPYSLDTIERIKDVYQHVDLIEGHISQLLHDEEGSAFSSDKTRYIMYGYKKYLQSGELPTWGERKEYWVPNFGSAELWMNFVEEIPMVALGIMDKYLEARTELLDDIRKKKEIKFAYIHKTLTEADNFVSVKEEPGLSIYRFEEGNFTGELVVSSASTGGYRCFNNENEENPIRLRGKEELPGWFHALLQLI